MLRTIVRKGIDLHYDRLHRREAGQALRTVEGQTKKILAKAVRHQAEEYAYNALGSRVFAPWLFVYSAIAGKFREGWIPDNYYGRIVCPRINGVFRSISGVKTLTQRLFQSDRIPDSGYLIDGRFFDRHLKPIPIEDAARVVFFESNDVVVKIDSSGKGRGVRSFSRREFDPVALAASTAQAVIQTRISQHRIFDEFVPGGATTLRLTTVREPDATFRTRAAYLRIPCGGHKFVQSSSSVRVAVDLASGVLAGAGYLSDWTRVASHPETGAAFKGVQIPGYFEAIKLCQDLHATVPQVGCIGWDVIVDTASRVWLLEWNAGHNDVRFSEALTGPCFLGLGWECLEPAERVWQM